MERPGRLTSGALLLGYLFHCLYAGVEFGDGDYFRVPFLSLEALALAEEFFELLSLEAYLAAFLYIYTPSRLSSGVMPLHGDPAGSEPGARETADVRWGERYSNTVPVPPNPAAMEPQPPEPVQA